MSSLRKKIRRKSPPRFANISHVSHDPAQRVTFAEPSTLVATLPARVAAFDNRHSRLDLGQPSTARGLLTDGNLFRLEKREIFAARRGSRREEARDENNGVGGINNIVIPHRAFASD